MGLDSMIGNGSLPVRNRKNLLQQKASVTSQKPETKKPEKESEKNVKENKETPITDNNVIVEPKEPKKETPKEGSKPTEILSETNHEPTKKENQVIEPVSAARDVHGKNNKTRTSIYLSLDVLTKIEEYAAKNERSTSYIIEKALIEYLKYKAY